VELDFYIPQGNNYRIGLESVGYLSRYVKDRRNPKDVGYPFILDNLVSIHSSTESEDPLDYYYFFYEWRVREPGCDFTLYSQSATEEKITCSPNPTSDRIMIKTPTLLPPRVFNDQGQQVNIPIEKTSLGWDADLSNQPSGLYFFESAASIVKVIKH
jgi:hypothetical protein